MDKRTPIIISIIGLGVAIFSPFIPYLVKDMPTYISVIGCILGVLLIIFGIISIFTDRIWRFIMNIRLHWPITFREGKQPIEIESPKCDGGIEVYANRIELTKAKGELSKELNDCEKVWAIWHEGNIAIQSDEIKKLNFERMVLTSPNDSYMVTNLAKRGEVKANIDTNKIKGKKMELQENAKIIAKNCREVRYYRGPISCVLILADKVNLAENNFSDKAWARVETGIPFNATNDRPHIVINKKYQSQQFDAFREHFELIWNNSDPIDTE